MDIGWILCSDLVVILGGDLVEIWWISREDLVDFGGYFAGDLVEIRWKFGGDLLEM